MFKDKILPNFETYKSKVILSNSIEKEQHFTQPPARYTEAKLVEEMEKLGIGRPSTYATIMSNIKDRGYVTIEDKKFHPTSIGIEVTDKLQEFFSNLINVKYTASMETDLDKIADGDIIWYQALSKFYKDFEPMVKDAFDNMEKKDPEKIGEDCPECGHPLVIRKGKYGEFIACSNFPECKYVRADEKKIKEVCDCPNCDGKIIEKKSKRGKVFYGCNNFPKCKTAYWDMPTGESCPECGSMLVKKNKKIKCSVCEYEEE